MKNIHDVDEENVYRTCTGGSARVPDVHRRGKIRYGADPRVVHDREPDVDRLHFFAVCMRMLPASLLCTFSSPPGIGQPLPGLCDTMLMVGTVCLYCL